MTLTGQANLVIYDEDFRALSEICERLFTNALAKAILLVDKDGQVILDHGETTDLDKASLASLTAGNVAATGGMAQLLNEKRFHGQFHEGEEVSAHISLIEERFILLTLFDSKSNHGLVKLHVRKACTDIAAVISELSEKAEEPQAEEEVQAAFADITDDDIDNLFND